MKNIFKILLGVMLAVTVCVIAYPVYTAFTGGSEEAVAAAIGVNLYWGYALLALVVISALFGSIYGMFKASTGLLKTILSFIAVAAIVVGSYLIAASHTIEITNIENGGFFPAVDTIITESSIIITYVVMGAAIVAAIASEVMGAFK
ncbi:MAG: hypothetical protein SNH94_04530 [Rikenellaceae bacterium]